MQVSYILTGLIIKLERIIMNIKSEFKIGSSISIEELEARIELSTVIGSELLEDGCKRNCNTGDNSTNCTARCGGEC